MLLAGIEPRGVATSRGLLLVLAAGLLAFSGCGGVGGDSAVTAAPSQMVMIAGNDGGVGSADGTGSAASFNLPMGLATDSGGNVYVADYNNAAVRKMTPAGVVTTVAGNSPGIYPFSTPYGVAMDGAGNAYVADAKASVIRKVTPAGVVSVLAGLQSNRGYADGTGEEARFYLPTGVATDSAGNVYVADMYNNAIRKITPAGVVTTVVATLNHPLGVAIDGAGNLYVPDSNNTLLRKISPTGTVTTLATTGGELAWNVYTIADGEAALPDAVGVAVDSVGNVYVADNGHNTILKVTAAGVVSALVGVSGQSGFQAGGLPGVIREPTGLAISGNTLYFSQPGGIGRVTNLF